MNLKLVSFTLLLTVFSACRTKAPVTKAETKLKEIVLVNAGGQRCEVGEMINLISNGKPKAIGINFLYRDERDVNCDSVLQQAISQSGKVVLCEGFENGNHVESHSKFLNPAMLSGLTGLSENDHGVIDSYYRIIDDRGRWAYSFPFHLALQYDLARDSELAAKSRPRDYPIRFYHSLDEFRVIDGLEGIKNNIELFKDKIVIIGSMGQATDNYFLTPVTAKSSERTFGTVIIANIILDILQDLNTDPVQENKYSEFIKEQQKSKNKQ